MTLSRTARILLAFLLAIVAAFLWINVAATTPAGRSFLARSTPSASAGGPPSVPDDAEDAREAEDARGAEAPQESAEREDGGDGAADPDADSSLLPFIARDDADPAVESEEDEADDDLEPEPGDSPAGPTRDAAPDEGPPVVVAPGESDVVGRDVVVAEFPFLFTAPPVGDGVAEDAEDPPGPGEGRPGARARSELNPFSPIVLRAPAIPASEEEAAAPPQAPDVVEVDVPPAPRVDERAAAPPAAPAPSAPAPRALAPSSPRTSGLPRALPSGSLPVAPDLLTDTRAEAAPGTPVRPPDVAIREPSDPADPPPSLRPVGGSVAAGELEPTPLAPGEVASSGVPDRPLVAGSDALSRYLRDRNVTFTGSVVGSVGVGVFRVAGTSAPVVLALGQPLPDSDIVLTNLRGQAAEFTLGDTSQVLNLDLRR